MHRTVVRATVRAAQARHASTSSTPSRSKPKSTLPKRKPKAQKFDKSRPPKPKLYTPQTKTFARFTDQLIRVAGNTQESGWDHMPSLRGEEMRLKKMVEKPVIELSPDVVSSSMRKDIFTTSTAVEEVEGEEFSVTPEAPAGSYVEIRRNEIADYGIVVGSGFRDRSWQMSILTSTGESWAVLKADCFFTIPSICPADIAARCGMETHPLNPSELGARVEVLKRLRKIQREVENAMSGISRQLDTIYKTVCAKDRREWSEVTTPEVASMLHPNPTAVEIYATHKILLQDSTRFVASPSYSSSQMLSVRPQEDVEDLLQVQSWVRERNPVIEKFITKAIDVAKVQKHIAEESMSEAPSTVPAEHRWTANDQTIIRFLRASLRHSRSVQNNPYTVSLGHIAKRLGVLDSAVNIEDNIHGFLVNIGVLAPWQDLIISDRINRLESNESLPARKEDYILRALENSKDPNPVHPEDFYPSDPLASIRHDWGDMPVYVVDDLSAEELDDGVSVESIPSEPENTWIHVHIANPTSLIPPTHVLAQQAASQSETWYLVPKSFPLFPHALVHHPTHGLSLGLRSRNGSPEHVITVSTKLSPNGDILDFTIRAGLIRNVKIIDYDSVDVSLGLGYSKRSYPFGNAPSRPVPQELDSKGIQDIKKLLGFARLLVQKRLAMNWFSFDRSKVIINRMSPFPDMPADVNAPHFYRGFPQLGYVVGENEADMVAGSRNTIAEMMKLASRVVSMWCVERNVPIIRRCSFPMVPASEESTDILLNARNEVGFVDEKATLKHVIYTPAGFYSTKPGMHWGVGIPEGHGYARITSPLRRYGDLIGHWQLHKALLQEKEGQPITGLYDQDYMDKFALKLGLKDQYLKGTHRRHNRYWALLFIKRWQAMFSDGKNRDLWPKDANGQPIADPLRNLDGYIVTTPKVNKMSSVLQVQIQIPRLGLKELFADPDIRDVGELGTTLPLRIDEIRLGVKPIMKLVYDKDRRATA